MCGSPDGYGSISSTYDFGASATSSLETSQVRSRSQISCHLGSMECGSNRRSLMGARRLARVAPRAGPRRDRIFGGAGVSESTLKGAIAEAAITARAVELGIVVLRPVVEGRRPIDVVAGKRAISLRLRPAANNQRSAINSAATYELGAIAQLGERVTGSHEVGGS